MGEERSGPGSPREDLDGSERMDRLRRRAEHLLDIDSPSVRDVPVERVRDLVHELQVHQIELEIQNDELRRVRDELEGSRARLAELYDVAPVGYVTLDTNGVIRSSNLTLAAMLGIERGAIQGTTFVHFMEREPRGQFLEELRQCLHEKGRGIEARLHGSHGRSFWAFLNCVPDLDPGGIVVEYRVTVADISARKRAEMELQSAHRDLQRVAEELERRVLERTAVAEGRATQLRALAVELSRAEQRQRRQLAQVLHDDMQQLLAAARLNVGILNSRLEDGDLRSLATEVYGLLEQSLDCSRYLTRELSPPVLAEGGLRAALDWCSQWAERHLKLDVRVQIDPSAEPEDEDDRYLLFAAVRELLLNVQKHSGVAHASIAMVRQGDDVHITVADDGSGFEPDGLASVGEKRSGFGLYSIQERLKALGGDVEIVSAKGAGTRVSLTLPIQRDTSDSDYQ